uniref:Leukocyte cell-derived chemotaxin 1 n=1 Tax=Mola mola TaxID=94237 RepID=A0A3Q3XP50_MOLML
MRRIKLRLWFTACHVLLCVISNSVQEQSKGCRLLRFGAAALIVGALLMLCATTAATCGKPVYNVRYIVNMNGEAREGASEIDSDNNLERFRTGSGAEEAVEIHGFQIVMTGIRFFGGHECYMKSQIKANLPHMGAQNKESLEFDGTDEMMPVRFDEAFLIWLAEEQPLLFKINTALKLLQRSRGTGDEGGVTFDTMLDQRGICCSECQRSYTHSQRIREPLRGYRPWPYDCRRCQVSCRMIMPCRWWVGGLVNAF